MHRDFKIFSEVVHYISETTFLITQYLIGKK